MLSKPLHGWVEVFVGEERIGVASYLTDPAMDLLDAFISYFGKDTHLPFGISFDAEGHYFGIMEFADYLYTVNDKTMSGYLNIKEIKPESLGLVGYSGHRSMLAHLADECIHDIQDNLEVWVDWFSYADEEKSVLDARRAELHEKSERVRNLIAEELEKIKKMD